MNAINALRFKIIELGKKHPLEEHYRNITNEIASLSVEKYQKFYVKWCDKKIYKKIA
jgi:hypothetical protein